MKVVMIRNFPAVLWQEVRVAAIRADQTTATWVAEAVEAKLDELLKGGTDK